MLRYDAHVIKGTHESLLPPAPSCPEQPRPQA